MTVLSMLGAVIVLIADIWIIVEAFRTSIIWGILALLIPFVGLVFVFVHWNRAGRAFILALIGAALAYLPALVR